MLEARTSSNFIPTQRVSNRFQPAVLSRDVVCHANPINTTGNDIDVEIAPQTVIPFDFCEFPGEEFSDSEPEYSTLGSQGYLSSYAERVESE